MRQRIFFRADASSEIGYGHFIRTLALAEMLKDDFDCTFYTTKPTDYQKTEVLKVCSLKELPLDDTKYQLFLDELEGNEIVFLDNYFFTPAYEKLIKDKGCKLVVLSPSKPHHYADVVINFVDKDLKKYSIESYTQIVAGLEWSILREPFRKPICANTRQRGSIVISFGGTDQFLLTERVVDILANNNLLLSVICTNRVSEERRASMKDKGVQVYTDIPAQKVAELYEQAEFAVLSSSTVCLEALSRGTKVLAGYYVDNQINFYNILIKEHCITGLGDLLEENCFSNLADKMRDASRQKILPIDYTYQKEKYISLFKSLCK